MNIFTHYNTLGLYDSWWFVSVGDKYKNDQLLGITLYDYDMHKLFHEIH